MSAKFQPSSKMYTSFRQLASLMNKYLLMDMMKGMSIHGNESTVEMALTAPSAIDISF